MEKAKSITRMLQLITGVMVIIVLFVSDNGWAGRWKDASDRHKQDCSSWCSGHEDCGRCLPLLPCPPGTKKLKSWTGYGKNWHACSKPVNRAAESRRHKQECDVWCAANDDCKTCSHLPCPPPSRNLKSWTGFGDNWYACKKITPPGTESREHRQACVAWCRNEPTCVRCEPFHPCPPGLGTLRSYRGPGKNWYACGKVHQWREGTRRQQKECRQWCENNAQCERCVTQLPCAEGTNVYKRFEGAGLDYYACGRPASVGSPPSHQHGESRRLPGRPAIEFRN